MNETYVALNAHRALAEIAKQLPTRILMDELAHRIDNRPPVSTAS